MVSKSRWKGLVLLSLLLCISIWSWRNTYFEGSPVFRLSRVYNNYARSYNHSCGHEVSNSSISQSWKHGQPVEDHNPETGIIGHHDVLGSERCFNSEGRFQGSAETQQPLGLVSGGSFTRWWSYLQQKCVQQSFRNSDAQARGNLRIPMPHSTLPKHNLSKNKEGRVAVILRSWDSFLYDQSMINYMEALVKELTLDTGGRYQVFLLVEVNHDRPTTIAADDNAYHTALARFIPKELQDMTILWDRPLLKEWYPNVRNHTFQSQAYQALQLFAIHNPTFSHIWQFEMDSRFTFHAAEGLDALADWARLQKRQHLWERNAAFYIPAIHGLYSNFSSTIDAAIGPDRGVWGPVRTQGISPRGPAAPARTTTNAGTWGVGEESDLITLMPMFDPLGSGWIYESQIENFPAGESLPRRAAVVSMTRCSHRLLRWIHDSQREKGLALVSEATPETFALLHGVKAVFVPHAITLRDHNMSATEIDAVFNQGPMHNMAGAKAKRDAHSMMENSARYTGIQRLTSYWWMSNQADAIWREYLDGRCTRPMILHPVKYE